MIQHCQDALAINRHFRGADFFLTMTANPNWPEIKEALLPGQSPSDRPDLVDRQKWRHSKRTFLKRVT